MRAVIWSATRPRPAARQQRTHPLRRHRRPWRPGVSIPAARGWQEHSTGRLRFETYQLLDTMLSLATEDDVRRFDLALRELGETRRS